MTEIEPAQASVTDRRRFQPYVQLGILGTICVILLSVYSSILTVLIDSPDFRLPPPPYLIAMALELGRWVAAAAVMIGNIGVLRVYESDRWWIFVVVFVISCVYVLFMFQPVLYYVTILGGLQIAWAISIIYNVGVASATLYA